jgi:hypothetical protein
MIEEMENIIGVSENICFPPILFAPKIERSTKKIPKYHIKFPYAKISWKTPKNRTAYMSDLR